MNKILITRCKRVLYVIATCVMTAITLVPVTAFAANNPPSLTVNQVFNTSSKTVDDTFTYRLRPLESDNPMPSGSTADGYTFIIISNENIQIDLADYSQPGLYEYELSQIISEEKPGYVYDKRVYTIEAHVDAALSVIIIAKNEDGTKAADIDFENSYSSEGGSTKPPGTTNPSSTTNPLSTTNPPYTTGGIDSGAQPNLTAPGPDMDLNEDNFTEIDINGFSLGNLELEDDEEWISDNFTPIGGGQPALALDPPKTGDDRNNSFYILLFASGAVLAICAAVYLIVGKKRKSGA